MKDGLLLHRTNAICLAALLCLTAQQLSAQITSNVLRRVLMIKIGDRAGTSFTIDVDGRQYLITAKHLTVGLKDEETIHVRRGDAWRPLKIRVLRCADPLDIAVLVPQTQLTVTFPLEPTMKGVRYGQDVYFAGFPYGLSSNIANVNGLYPIAFMKKGIMSASRKLREAVVIFVDGHNNPGFSGGPVVFRDLTQRDLMFKVLGVVSGFHPEYTPVLQPESISSAQVTPEDRRRSRILSKDGSLFRLNETEQLVRLNTGIVIAYSISHAIDLIHENPSGPEVSEDFSEEPLTPP